MSMYISSVAALSLPLKFYIFY